MKKKVYYKLNRYQVTKVEVETAEQEQAVKMLNRDTDRFAKSEDTYRERYASLDEMYEESGFEPADDSPTPEEQFLENEKNEAIKRLVAKAMEELTEKQKIVEAFKDWIFRNPQRRDELETIYNRLFNQIRLPKYDGRYLRFPEMNPAIELRPHQKDAVHRIITSGNTLLHHIVGSGKTFTICAAAMKLRQYGLAKKPMIAVPNHLVQQWANSFRELYPTAKLLIATKDDLDKDHREQFVSKVAMGDWDSVIIAQSSFAKINISPERQIAKIQEEIAAIERSIEMQWEDSNSPSGSVKNLERIKKGREAQLKKVLDESKKDNVLIFEKLGVDYLFVDEADAYKNLFLYTKMNNVAGISNAASARASDLQLKIEYINELHGGDKGVVFATGTPISNSMTEMYTMQTYLQKRTLEKLGIDYFDAWAADFGETVTALELAPSGKGYRARTRFAKFTNLPELLTLYHSFADVKTDVKLDVPEAERKVITLKPSDTVIDLTEEIAKRADAIYAGGVDPHIDNMLKVTGDGKKLALDPRCINPLLPAESGSKLNFCADNVCEEWKNSAEIKGTQLVFCDLSTPSAFVRADLKIALFDEPEEEKTFIDESDRVAAMQVDILPDYTVSQEQMHEYGYTWDGMLPVRIRTARVLYGAGVELYRLGKDDTEGKVESGEFEDTESLYGVEKPAWQASISSERGKAYLTAWHNVVESASEVVREDMSYLDGMYADSISDNFYEERTAIDRVLNGEFAPSEEAKPFIKPLLERYHKRFPLDILLEYYGWDYGDVYKALAENIPDAELREYATNTEKEVSFDEFMQKQLADIDWSDMVDGENDGSFDDIISDLKPEFENSAFNESNDEYPYDYWYDDFAEEKIMPYLREQVKKSGYKSINEPVLVESPNYKELVVNNIEKEFEEFKANLMSKSAEEIFQSNYEIHIKTELFDTLCGEYVDVGEEYYRALYEEVDHGGILQQLYDDFISSENASVSTGEDTIFFIKDYCEHYHSDVMKEYKEQLDKEDKTLSDFTKVTARGDKVVSISKDGNGRDIAIIDRTATSNKDYVVAIGYHTATGDWEQGRYGFESQEKAENWRKNEYGSEKPKIEYTKINVANDAFIKKSGVGSVFKMPTNGEYAGFTYYMFNDKIRPSRQLVDLQSDSRELCYELSVRDDREIELRKGYGDNEQIVVLTAEEFKEAVGGTTNKDYETQENTDTKWLNTSVPQEAFRKEYPKSMLFVLPNKQDFGGMSFFIPSAFVGEDKNSDDGRILIRLPEDFVIKAQSRDETREATLTAYDFNRLCNNTTAEDYKQAQAESAQGSETPSDWNYVSVPEKARIASFDESTLFRMPDGKYQDYTYYVPNKCVKENAEKGTIRLSLHNDYTVRLSDNSGEEKKTAELTAKDFCEEVRGKDAGAYGADYKRPSVEANTSFDEKEKALRTAVPDEMKKRPNWVVVKTWWNAEKGKYNKRPVNCNSDKGEYAESDNPETWTTFDNALKYLKEKGGTTVAYALDGKDNISCIDLDHCYDENGQQTALAKEVLSKCGKTYVEKSVSGNGLHIFGKTSGMDIRTFSKDGDLEFYQKEHFIAMTGDGTSYSRLESFDTPEMKELLFRKCEKREGWKGVCKGVNGLSTMTDRDVVEKASNAKNGDKFKKLYAGEDLQNNHSNSDMSLMNLFAYWCNGDKEQMLRIFATSGLFRPNKSPDYYEGTAIKALRSMPVKSTYTPTIPKNTGGNGKR